MVEFDDVHTMQKHREAQPNFSLKRGTITMFCVCRLCGLRLFRLLRPISTDVIMRWRGLLVVFFALPTLCPSERNVNVLVVSKD